MTNRGVSGIVVSMDIIDIMNMDDLAIALANGLVSVQEHPVDNLYIYSYTKKAQTTPGAWENPAVRLCRGLIVTFDGEIIARPYPKFFNLGQPEAPEVTLDDWVVAMDKIDGSLGIIYPRDDGTLAVATRGSFTSRQADHATKILQTKYPDFVPPLGHTTLVEIVYPENKIVVDYGAADDLVLLGFVHIETGRVVPPVWNPTFSVSNWTGPVADFLYSGTLGVYLSIPPRDNREGAVLYLNNNEMVKVKYEEYLRLHRIATGLSEKIIWEVYFSDEPGMLSDFLEDVPDEFHSWVAEVWKDLDAGTRNIMITLETKFAAILDTMFDMNDRAVFAQAVAAEPEEYHAMLFARLDGYPIKKMIAKQLKPKGDTRLFANRKGY